jgi:pimeloyl-ACP methyl ester carboxylesterase
MKKVFAAMLVLFLATEACVTLIPNSAGTQTPVSVENAGEDESAVGLEGLGGEPCPDSDFTCVTLTVPLNHFDPQDQRTIEVDFAVLPATGERKGMFVTATGGPGTAGISVAKWYVDFLDPSIPEHFDIVFFDQRGTGRSGGLQCTAAAARFYSTSWEANTPEEESELMEVARTFSRDCVSEMGNPEMLPYLGTEQAAEDLETFRQAMGDEKIWLYGESYGTQYAQTYAAAHPENIAGMVLDGTVDLTLSALDFYNQQAQGFSEVLQLTLAACNADEFCAESMGGGDAAAAYDKLAARLEQSPLAFDFPTPSGGKVQRTFSFNDLEIATLNSLYSETERMIFLRALAAYSQTEDLVPFARLLYTSLMLDPESLEAMPDPTYSNAVYYGVECRDYGYFSGTPEEKATAYLRAGDGMEDSLPHFSSTLYSDLPCAFWPAPREDDTRPAPLTADGIPTLVLAATADPATPVSNGQSVYSRLSDGYLITLEGGPHIIFGRGDPCVDDLVTNFLVDDQTPPERETTCEGVVVSEFVPLSPSTVAQFENLIDIFYSVDDEIYFLPEYYYWDFSTPTSVGCPFGGTLSFQATDTGDALTLDHCTFSRGFEMTGSGSTNYDDGLFILEVDVSGVKNGSLTYTRDGNWSLHVEGTYGGEEIDLWSESVQDPQTSVPGSEPQTSRLQ